MIKPILELFSSSMLGRLIGLLRFQVILYVFGQNEFSDNIIYFTTFIWLVNNFFVIPNVNSSIIADLDSNEEKNHNIIIINFIRRITKVSLSTGLIALLFLFFVNSNDIFSLDILSLVLIFFTFPLLGINEIISLYNQYKGKYFLYSFNPVIWNLILIICLLLYWVFDIQNLYTYFIFLLLAKLTSIIIQYKFSNLNLFKIYKNRNFKIFNPSTNIYYTLSIIIFSSITFFDLTVLNLYSAVGALTVYSIFLKIPTLLLSLITSSTLPVFFNRIIMNEGSLFKNFLHFSGLSFLLFLSVGFVYLFLDEFIFNSLFNYIITKSDKIDIYLALLFMFISSFAFFLIRLSVEFKFQKAIFIYAFLGIIIKTAVTYLCAVNIRNLILLSILVVSLISISGSLLFLFNYNKRNL